MKLASSTSSLTTRFFLVGHFLLIVLALQLSVAQSYPNRASVRTRQESSHAQTHDGDNRALQSIITSNSTNTSNVLNEVLCPILNLLRPDTSSAWKFISDINKRGNVTIALGTSIALGVITSQQGLWAVLTGKGPDIFRLDQVPLISHGTLYQLRMDGVKTRLEAKADADGLVTLADMVAVKRWVGQDTGAPITIFSKLETVLLFNLAGGDINQKVQASTVVNILEGVPLARFGANSFPLAAKGLLAWHTL
jgi:hypothetical protein